LQFKGRANPGKLRKTHCRRAEREAVGKFHQPRLGETHQPAGGEWRELIERRMLDSARHILGKEINMLGKIAGALIGKRIAGRNSGAKGAILGYGVAALARRGLGPLAAAAAIGWGAKKLYERRARRSPSYPSDAAPSSPGD
jgi:hypothetical protein